MSRTWSAALLSPPFATLSYLAPECLPEDLPRPGMRFLAPVGGSRRVVVLLAPRDAPLEKREDGGEIVLKPLLWPLDREPLFSPEYLGMVEQLACRQMREPGYILGSVLPKPLRSAFVQFVLPSGGRNRIIKPKELSQFPQGELEYMAKTWLDGRLQVRETGVSAEEVATVTKDPPWPVRPVATRQIALLEYLWEHGGVTKRGIVADLGEGARSALSTLVERGLVKIGPPPGLECDEEPLASPPKCEVCLTEEQQEALYGLESALTSAAGETRLLYGVTGSGKTMVYLELARRALMQGRSVFLLAPEIALAQNLRRAAASFFNDQCVPLLFYHGYLPPSQRAKLFTRAARANGPVLVVGTRSALFLPAPAPGCVILDEEHDSSFKQDERLSYQAKEVGFFLAMQQSGLLVLGSATPDVKTFYAAEQGFAPALSLTHRISSTGMPEIDLVDIRGLSPTEHLLAPDTVKQLVSVVERGDQAIIMLNRRGYSPLMYCLECGKVARCEHCEIGLTYHKGRERLVCHYCGHSVPYPLICPTCGSSHYLPMGEGTERLEETLTATLPPGTGVLRLDRDSTRRPGRMEEILQSFARGEARVLVGTQMLSKGHHFPQVTQVIVADGDLGLNLPDYRAAERTFQLLVQVAGRAGRGEKAGRVLIQTRDMANPCWGYIRANDYAGFYATELEMRRRRKYPPFVKLALIRVSFPMDWEQGGESLTRLSRILRQSGKARGVLALGPAPAPLRMLRGRKRFHCLLKAQDWPSIRCVFHDVLAGTKGQDELRLSLDLDPVDML